MNLPYELSKVKDAFKKVRTDMKFISDTISENYTTFMSNHKELSHRIDVLSTQLHHKLEESKDKISSNISNKDVHDLKLEIKELKEEISHFEKEHAQITHKVTSLEKKSHSTTSNKEVNDKIHQSELEIFLLKERMIEKDLEMKQFKDINKRLYELVNSLAKTEIKLLEQEHGL